jgi:hypothetical protein
MKRTLLTTITAALAFTAAPAIAQNTVTIAPEVKAAIVASIKASNHPNATDHRGGMHEEGGVVGYDADGNLLISTSTSGQYSAHKSVGVTLVSAEAMVKYSIMWHTHPGALNPQTMQLTWVQPPSQTDIQAAAAMNRVHPGTVHIVIGIGDSTVYFYDGTGVTGQESLKKFLGN